MKFTKKTIVLILLAVIVNVGNCFLLSRHVFADEGYELVNKILAVNIIYKDSVMEHSTNEIYYVNDPVELRLPDTPCSEAEEKEIIDKAINEAKNKNPDKVINTYYEDKLRKAIYNGNEFLEYVDCESSSVVLNSLEDTECDKQAIKFEMLRSYKLYIGDNKNEVVGVVDIKSQSPIYQFVFDKSAPKIANNSLTNNLEVVNEGEVEGVTITDETGIRRIEVFSNDKVIDTVNIGENKRVTKYEYDVLLTRDYGDVVNITIKASDVANNESQYTFCYEIDSIKPEVYFTGIENGGIYKNNATLSISGKDDRGKVFVYYKCVYTDLNGNEICKEDECFENDNQVVANRNYSEEGIYDVIAYAYDNNGNYSDVITCCFAVDSNAPEITIGNVENGKIYGQNVTLYAIVKEPFFENMDVNVNVELTDKNGKKYNSKLDYTVGSRLNKNIYTFSESGQYKITIAATDTSLHTSISECTFSIDRKAPCIEICYQLDDEINELPNNVLNGTRPEIIGKCPRLVVRTTDDNIGHESYAILYKKDGNDIQSKLCEKVVTTDNENAEIVIPINSEGKYVLKVIATDKAMNVSAKAIEFIVDETPPVIGYINDFNEKYLTSFVLPNQFSNYIKDMTGVSYKAYLNTNEIKTCDIKKDGKYILQVVATDDAGNSSEEMIAFIVDETLPKIIVSGIDEDGVITKENKVKLTLFDEDDYFTKVSVNGVEKKITGDGHTVIIETNEDLEYNISVEAVDFAGNKINKEIKAVCGNVHSPVKSIKQKVNAETLTKKDAEIRETFFDKITGIKFVIFCGFIFATAVIFAVIAFVDMHKLKG